MTHISVNTNDAEAPPAPSKWTMIAITRSLPIGKKGKGITRAEIRLATGLALANDTIAAALAQLIKVGAVIADGRGDDRRYRRPDTTGSSEKAG